MTEEVIDQSKIWYDRGPLLSYSQAVFYMALGARGTGKTFNFKKWAITKESQTVWVRRYDVDIDDLTKKGKFLGDLFGEGVIPDEDVDRYKILDNILYIDEVPRIFFIGLNTSERVKSQSFHDVDIIIYDEFLTADQSKYLNGEVDKFLELYETVNRLRIDGRKEVRAIFIANKISFVNPYFTYWNILPFEERFKTFKDGLIVVENYRNNDFVELKKQTKFGKLISGTKYGDYAIDNIVWQDDSALIQPRPLESKCIANIHVGNNYMGLWVTNGNDAMYVARECNKKLDTFGVKYQCLDDEYPMSFNTFPLKILKELYLVNRLFFTDTLCKNVVFTLMQTEKMK